MGTLRVNDLPMSDFQREWNKSICTLVDKRALSPPSFDYDPEIHEQLLIAMSDASHLYVSTPPPASRYTVSRITVRAASKEEEKPLDETQSKEEAKLAKAPASEDSSNEDKAAELPSTEEANAVAEAPATEAPQYL